MIDYDEVDRINDEVQVDDSMNEEQSPINRKERELNFITKGQIYNNYELLETSSKKLYSNNR